jgi:hypothetical protein
MKEFYKPEDVKKAHKKSKWFKNLDGLDFSCWAMYSFTSHIDSDKYHEQKGEVCNYGYMKAEILCGLSGNSILNLTEIPDLNIDASWLNFGDVFEGFGKFISVIFS